MPALIAIAWGAALAVASGGRIQRLRYLNLEGAPALLGLFIVQGIARGRLFGGQASDWGLVVWGLASLALVIGLMGWTLTRAHQAFRRGIVLVALGTALNLLVVLLNEFMPVSSLLVGARNSVERFAGFYGLANASTSLAVLGDTLVLPLAGVRYLLSVGDILLVVGVAAVVCEASMSCDLDHRVESDLLRAVGRQQ